MKKTFILHVDSLLILNEMTNEQKGILFDAILKYHLGEDVELDFAMRMAFAPFKNQFIRDEESYNAVVERNRQNGKNGGRPPKEENPKNPVGLEKTQLNQENPKNLDTDSVNNSDSVSDNKKEKEIKKKYGQFGKVLLTETEYNSANEKYSNLLPLMIKKLDEYIASKGAKYKSHYATFSSWVHNSVLEDMKKGGNSQIKQNYNSIHGISAN
jgi:hypothetical protein